MSFYTSILLSAKNASSEPIVAALDEFIQIFLTADDLKPVQSQMDKMCLRSPEIILPFMQHFYTHFSDISALSSSLTTSLDNTIQNLSKSTNAAVRAGAVTLFAALVDRAQPDASQKVVVSTIDFLKSGKSVSADQRAARACMLAAVQPCDQSKAIIDAVITVLPKETNVIALQALMKAFSVHAKGLLSNASIDVAKVLVKGMTDAKPPLRKAVCIGVAEALWEAESVSEAFQDALLPALEINIKNATTTPLTNTAGPLEGYIAVALLQHVLTSPKSAAFRTENPVMASITQVGGVKPSFLYWDKAIKKAETDAEQIWLVRAAARTLLSRQAILEEQEDLPAYVLRVLVSVAK